MRVAFWVRSSAVRRREKGSRRSDRSFERQPQERMTDWRVCRGGKTREADITAWQSVLRRKRVDLLRVGSQTAAATLITYLTATWLALDVSWAVLAALFTIGLSADASYFNARGRIIGAFLGLGLGLIAGWAAPSAVLAGLVFSAVVANMLATLWPSIRYAAVTAAIVALDPSPTFSSAVALAGAILSGTLIAAATSFLLWPTFGRTRVLHALGATLTDCRDLLRLTSRETGTEEDRSARGALNARFLEHLDTCHARMSSTQFKPMNVHQVADAIESLWYSIVILDRTMRRVTGAELSHELPAALHPVHRQLEAQLDDFAAALGSGREQSRLECTTGAVSDARREIGGILARSGRPSAQVEGLHALSFALAEVERTLGHLGGVLDLDAADLQCCRTADIRCGLPSSR